MWGINEVEYSMFVCSSKSSSSSEMQTAAATTIAAVSATCCHDNDCRRLAPSGKHTNMPDEHTQQVYKYTQNQLKCRQTHHNAYQMLK